MNVSDAVICQSCQTTNLLSARACINCGGPLTTFRAQYYLNLADQDILAGEYGRASQNLVRADGEMFTLSQEQRRESLLSAYAFLLQAIIYYQKGQIDNAHNELNLALQNAEGVAGGKPLEARILNQLGNVALYQNNDTAAEYYQRGSKAAMAADEHGLAATSMGNLGIIYFNNGEIEKALACYNTSAQQAELADEPARRGNAYRLLATFYASQGPYSKALEATEQALSLLPQINNSAAICRITNVSGVVYLNYGDLAQAEHWLRYSDDVARRNDNKLTQVENSVSLAELMRRRGEYTVSLDYAMRAYTPLNITPVQRSETLAQLIILYIETENPPIARKFLKLLQELCATNANSSDLIYLHRCDALIAITEGKWDEAERKFSKVVELVQSRHDKYTLTDLHEEYTTHLLNATNSDILQAHAYKLLVYTASSFNEMEMPLRAARVEAMLKQYQNKEADN